MKVVILCGGLGSRLAEETKLIPKPMVKIGNIPIVQHIINFYKKFGLTEFIQQSSLQIFSRKPSTYPNLLRIISHAC